jgi:long-chain fatty acid transport protein
MQKSASRGLVILFALLTVALTTPPALAINAHFLHGIGAANAAMGGAGVAVPSDVLSALHNNPALLTRLEDQHFSLSILYLDGDSSAAGTVQTPFGSFGGETDNESDPFLIPALGWSRSSEERPWSLGVGVLGIAGFASDFPQDLNNPLFAPEPSGFGPVTSDYQLLQVPLSWAVEVNERFALGLALVGGYATLQASPFGGGAPDCTGPTTCFFPRLDEASAFGVGGRLGLLYSPRPDVHLGLTYTSPIVFEDFTWDTTVRNPDRPDFGAPREVRFNVDVPQTLAAGFGYTPGERFKLGFDVKWINYSDTDGFEGGFDPTTLAANGLDWDDIVVLALGAEVRIGREAALRFGWNHTDAAIDEDSVFFNVASQAQFEDTASVGVGFPLYGDLNLDLTYYHVFETELTGAFQSPFGPVPGTEIESKISADALVTTFSFAF